MAEKVHASNGYNRRQYYKRHLSPGVLSAILDLGLCKDGQHVLDELSLFFDIVSRMEFRVDVPFSREGWHGRMHACRGVGAAMDDIQLAAWNEDHMKMLEENAPDNFMVKHYISLAELQVKK